MIGSGLPITRDLFFYSTYLFSSVDLNFLIDMFIVMVFFRISVTVIFRPLWRSHTEALVGTLL